MTVLAYASRRHSQNHAISVESDDTSVLFIRGAAYAAGQNESDGRTPQAAIGVRFVQDPKEHILRYVRRDRLLKRRD